LNLKAIGYTDKGVVRSNNQDSFLVHIFSGDTNNNSLVAIVADGVGGAKAGSTASIKAVDVVKDYLLNEANSPQHDLKRAIEAANQEIYTLSSANEEYRGMATTCSALMIKDNKVITGHVGDSRIYRIRDKEIERLSEDHTLPMRLFKNGEIDLTELDDHPQSHVLTNALGARANVEVDMNSSSLMVNDMYILCSDGLYKYLNDDELIDVASQTPLDSLPEKLVAMANERGGSDNITVIVVKVNDDNVSNRTVRISGDFFDEVAVKENNNIKKNIPKYIIAAILLMAAIFFISSRLK